MISAAKSPQQILGTIVKKMIAAQLDVNPSRIIHVTVMPCFDKKLEGSRM
jgi:iron only hydrogenase large subunit-like protein